MSRSRRLAPEWRFLASSAVGAALVANAYRPHGQSRAAFAPRFFASWLTIETSQVQLVTLPAATALALARAERRGTSVHRTAAGRVGLALRAASWVGLAGLLRTSLGTGDLIEGALGEFGADHRAAERARRGRYAVTRNIPYATVDGTTLRLDVYRPPTPPAPGERRPALLQVHGGGWVIGDKREQGLPLQRHLAANGWVCFNANYRLSPKVAFPTHLVDLKRALAWIREHADEYGIDPDFVCVTGGSAGGHLSSLLALTANRPEYQPGFTDADTSVAAAVPFYGVYDFTNRNGHWYPQVLPDFIEPWVMKAKLADEPERFAAASPLDQVHEDAPPFFVIHGDLDTLAPVEDARLFVEALRRRSRSDTFYVELRGAQHAFDLFRSPRADRVILAVHRFLDTVWAAHRDGRHGPPATVTQARLEHLVDA